ncbi:HNH endonuclease [Virgibacillus sp. MSJ-26]|uniref:HNH endonuclease n=1 Tax=Virgibacillus sp. MSJ-26 TaxID=2841522 RepID=UPI001C0F3DDC|nr:HNH endonuclease [Virgibacillus sp. MSJ-26]MBU5465785.1 HNH endonuclease [Virgibacillus sp. MSJ-26]
MIVLIEELKLADDKREETLELLEAFDQGLVGEYSQSIPAQEAVYGLFSELLNATEQGGDIQPINFDAHAYKNSEAHDLKDAADETKTEYLNYKDEQQEAREMRAEAERIENMAWYEKAWEYGSTFVGELTGYYDARRAIDGIDPTTGEKMSDADRLKHATFALAGFIPVVGWAGRAAKGGKAIHSTAKGMKAVDNSLSAYQYGKSLDVLRKTEYGIYGLASANGFGEYITGKDMFGNELSEEKRNQSLTESLFILGVSGMGMYADRLIDKNAVYAKPPSGNTPNNGIMNTIDQSISQGINNLNSMIHGPKLAHEFAGCGTNVTVSSFKDTLQRVNKVNSRKGSSLEDITDIAKTSGKNYNKVELDEVVAHGYDKNGTLKERWVIPKGYNSIDEFLESVDDVSIKSFGYDSVEEFKEVAGLVNNHLNSSPNNNILNKSLAGGTHVKGVDYDVLGFPIFKGDDVKFSYKLNKELFIASDTKQFKNSTKALKDAINKGEIPAKLFTPKQLKEINLELPRITDLTWHHHQVPGKMQLVVSDTHSVNHLGGNKLWGGGIR